MSERIRGRLESESGAPLSPLSDVESPSAIEAISGQRERRLTGYCTRCGGNCYDDGKRCYHRCPPARPEAANVVALKFACERFDRLMEKRSWAGMISRDDCLELRDAVRAMAEALRVGWP